MATTPNRAPDPLSLSAERSQPSLHSASLCFTPSASPICRSACMQRHPLRSFASAGTRLSSPWPLYSLAPAGSRKLPPSSQRIGSLPQIHRISALRAAAACTAKLVLHGPRAITLAAPVRASFVDKPSHAGASGIATFLAAAAARQSCESSPNAASLDASSIATVATRVHPPSTKAIIFRPG